MNQQEHTNEQSTQDKETKLQYQKVLAKKPKKPFNAYFKFRMQKLVEFHDFQDRVIKVKEAWQHLDPAVKEKMQKQYKSQLLQYHQQFDQWKKQLSKYAPSIIEQKQNTRNYKITRSINKQIHQQQDCQRCQKLQKQKAKLQQQIINLQDNHSKTLQILAVQSKWLQKQKKSNQQLLQRLKIKQQTL